VVALLEDGRADLAVLNSDALCFVAAGGQADVVRALLYDGRADPTACNSHALRFAAANGWPPVVAALLADGRADPTAVGIQGCLPLVQPMMARAVRWRRRQPWLRAVR
jgi:hypothetical protein